MIVSFVLYILLVRLLGFILCTFALIFAQMLFLSKGKVLKALIIAAVVSVAFYVIFRVIIGARLPTFSLF